MEIGAGGPRQRFTTLELSDCVETELCAFFPLRRWVFIVVGVLKRALKVRLGEGRARTEGRACAHVNSSAPNFHIGAARQGLFGLFLRFFLPYFVGSSWIEF